MSAVAARGVCPGCREKRHVTTAGFLRLHHRPNGAGVCPGAGQPPLEDGTPAAPKRQLATPPPGTRLMPAKPTEPTWGRSCDGGHCNAPSVGWRLYRDQREWLPVCGLHMGEAPERARVYDRDLDQEDE